MTQISYIMDLIGLASSGISSAALLQFAKQHSKRFAIDICEYAILKLIGQCNQKHGKRTLLVKPF
jgi:hypothetical protein